MRRFCLLLLPVLLSGCAVAPDITADAGTSEDPIEERLVAFQESYYSEPSAISPDEDLLCRGERADECFENGELRWSLPLEGTYLLRANTYEPLGLHHADTGAHSLEGISWPGAGRFAAVEIEGQGTVVYAENTRFRALDATTGEQRWRVDLGEALDRETFLHTGLSALHHSGDALLARFERALVVVDPDDGEVETVVRTSHRLGTLTSVVDGHALFRSGDRNPLFTSIDLDRGEVVWTGLGQDDPEEDTENDVLEYVGAYGPHAYLTWTVGRDSDLLALHRSTGWFVRVDVHTGELEHLITDGFEGLRRSSTLSGVHPDGYVVLNSEEAGVQYAYDFADDEFLWEGEARRGGLTPVETRSGPAFRHLNGTLLDAATGEPLAEGTEVESLAEVTPRREARTGRDQDRMTSWVETGGYRGGPVGLGTYGLLRTDEFAMALACAPDGVGELGAQSGYQGVPCERPRLYTVNLDE
ncbi:PQQ-like beta-propeller repeat protein [Nocardiopsis exhalans]|uniref:PQQ-like beta-propeller repeat protein n=1 Tax=Nocardiopsis exhalans TaxID=163604 RepID=A0ABY5DGP8_9ACTN|nr:PQQ-binding-like beta-propeller repeat protein [Nocardiopsis exhalans]USY22956.1 PQQ-like beta-propeller repeat protein [Nocardiopsis exhalans]